MTKKRIFRIFLNGLSPVIPGLFLILQACNTEYFDPPDPGEKLTFLSQGLFSSANDIIFTTDGNMVIAGGFSDAQINPPLTVPSNDFGQLFIAML